MKNREWRDFGAIGFALLPLWAGVFLFRSLGAYPANDDFLYARDVAIWLQDGPGDRVALNGLPTVSAVTLVTWGWLWCSCGGFDYTLLHTSVAVLASAGIVGQYLAARAVGLGTGGASLLALTLAVNPFYFGHGFTFMTDTPAVALLALAIAAYAWGIRCGSLSLLLAGGALGLAAVWTRQNSVTAILFPTLTLLLLLLKRNLIQNKHLSRQGLLISWLVPLVVAGFLPLVGYGVQATGVFAGRHITRAYPGLAITWPQPKVLLLTWYSAALVVGFSTLPTMPVLIRCWIRAHHWIHVIGAIPGLLFLLAFLNTGGRAALTNATGYFLQNAHFGPVLLSDAHDIGRWGDMGGVAWPFVVWQLLTILAILQIIALGAVGTRKITSWLMAPSTGNPDTFNRAAMGIALALTALANLVLLSLLLSVHFDRYWMILFPFILTWIASLLADDIGPTPLTMANAGTRAQKFLVYILTVLLLLLQGGIAFTFTHDYLAWNQTRWQLVEELLSDGIPTYEIHGGFEVNGWFVSAEDRATRENPHTSTNSHRSWSGRARWFLAIGPRAEFDIHQQRRWYSWATGREHTIYVLRPSAP